MKKSHKACLLSALIFPGAGHYFLEKYIRALLYAVISIGCLYFLLTSVVEIAQGISEQILNGEIPMDVSEIVSTVTKRTSGVMHNTADNSVLLLIACWLVSSIDAYWSGSLEDKKDRQQSAPDA